MEEFKRLPWPVADIGTDLEETYALNMSEYQKNHPTDVFFCHLLDIDPINSAHKHQKTSQPNGSTESNENMPLQFVDPRTGVGIPSHECNYENVNLKTRNIFLTRNIQASILQKYEHVACLNALRCSKFTSNQSLDEQKDCMQYASSAMNRFEEKRLFLEKLREHYFAKLVKRFHAVPPSIDYFITQNWKKQLIAMHRRMANAKYRMRTAISLLPSNCIVRTNTFHQEHMGNVPKMTSGNIEYLRQSFPNLMKAYHRRKNTQLLPVIKEKVKHLAQEHVVDCVMPISILKCILTGENGSFCMTVRESALSTIFNPKKEIVFEKPLPSTYLSGNQRYKNGAKYLLYSCLNQHSSSIFNLNERKEIETGTQSTENDDEDNDTSHKPMEVEYKISSCDEFMKKVAKSECSHENMTFSIFDITGCEDSDEDGETFKILVPAKQAAYRKDDNGDIEFVNYSPKIEFQAEYGAEMMTKDELIREWCDLFFRPDTKTERVRFDSVSGKMIHRQTVTLMEVETELEDQCGTETQQLLQRLWHSLKTFSEFPAGEYLLQSDTKRNDYFKVYERTDNDTESLSIGQMFKNITFEPNLLHKAEWQPIDDRIVTEIHEKFQILPCAFPHTDYLRENNVKSPKIEHTKQTKMTKRGKQILKIFPQDDSLDIIQKIEAAHMKKKGGMRQIAQRKQQKKMRNRARRKIRDEAGKAEAEEFQATKNFLVAMMDQYNTPQEQSLATSTNQNTESISSSIAARTRRRSRCMSSSETQQAQNVRRSDRVGTNKWN